MINLVASMIVSEVEPGRYLVPCVDSLLEFCDQVVMLLDGDGAWAKELGEPWGKNGSRVVAASNPFGTDFFAHEGKARQTLYDLTLGYSPTHVLAIDADEFVTDGKLVREAIEKYPETGVWSLPLDEVWRAEDECLCIRTDGAWGNRSIYNLFATPPGAERWQIANRALACGREPQEVIRKVGGAGKMNAEVLHFGWANEGERRERHARYAKHDQGNFHTRRHLDSILWPDERVILEARDWPEGLRDLTPEILARTTT